MDVAVEGDGIVKLPKYVVFKGDNGKYLAAYSFYSHEYLQFNSTDIGDNLVRHQVVEVGDGAGTVYLNCLYWNKFWRRSPNWIWADTVTVNSSNTDLLFRPIKVDDQRVALRCLGNNLFCKRLTTEGNTDCLNAGTGSLEQTTILGVEEPVLSRKVHSIVYDMDNAHIYDFQPGSLFRATATNPSDKSTTLQVAYSYMTKKSTSWKRAVSFKTGVKTTIQAGIPFVVEGKVDISAEVTISTEWGGTEETQTTVTGTYTVQVEARQTVEVTVIGAHAKCDVPFSYIQADLLTTGETVETHEDDGVFSGVNTTDVKFDVRYL